MSLPLPALRSSMLALALTRTALPLPPSASTSRTFLTSSYLLQQNGETPARSHRAKSASQVPSQLHSKDESQGVSPATGLGTAATPSASGSNAATERNEQTYATAKGVLDGFARQLRSDLVDPNAASPPPEAAGISAAAATTATTTSSTVGGSVFTSPLSTPAAPPTLLSAQSYTATALPPRTDPLLSFLTNLLMKDGKKAQSERFVYHALSHIRTLTNSDPLPLLYSAVEQVRPLTKMQSRKQGGKTLQVPIVLTQRQSERKALVWIIETSKKRSDKDIAVRLAKEFVAVVEGASAVYSRKEEQHKIATANRANAAVRI